MNESQRERFEASDRARMMKMGSREIAKDIALMEEKGLGGGRAHALAVECYDACLAIERGKSYDKPPPGLDA